jgi:putative tricarboxylic transport membrane protein
VTARPIKKPERPDPLPDDAREEHDMIDAYGRRTVLRTAGLAIAAGIGFSVSASGAAAQTKAPVGPIEITVGCSAGCTPDILMRRAAKIWNEQGIITNPIVIVNRVGGGMMTGMKYVLDRPGDANNLMALAEPVFSTPIVQGTELTYNRFTPLGVFVQTQLVILGQPNHPAKTLKEMVEFARANPKQVKMAGSSAGGTDEQVMGLIEAAMGVDMTFIPHSGGGAAQATFLGGNTELITVTLDEALPHIQAGKARPLAILNDARRTDAAFKDVPTAKEQGINVVWGQVFGLLGAPNLDPAVTAWWTEKINALTATPAWKTSISDNFLGGDVYVGPNLPAQMKVFHEQRLDVLRKIGAAKM